MTYHAVSFALLFLTPAPLTAAPKVGGQPPAIHFDKLIPEQPAVNASFNALSGKVVVVEMWATWCGPCIHAISHLNQLAEEFKGSPIVFLSVTDEDPKVVEEFLKTHPISGWVGIAHTDSPLARYGVDGIPATFLIDVSGKVAGSIDPELLTVSMLESLIHRQPLPAVDLTIRPSPMRTALPPARWVRNGLVTSTQLRSIISQLWNVKSPRVSGEPLNDWTSYDLSLSTPGSNAETFQARAREVIASAFHINVTRETRDSEVWVLSRTGSPPPGLKPGGSISDMSGQGAWPAAPPAVGGSLKLLNSEVSMIAELLESVIQKPVVDETGVVGEFALQISWDRDNRMAPIEAIRKAGFKVEAGRRKIDFLTVTRRE